MERIDRNQAGDTGILDHCLLQNAERSRKDSRHSPPPSRDGTVIELADKPRREYLILEGSRFFATDAPEA